MTPARKEEIRAMLLLVEHAEAAGVTRADKVAVGIIRELLAALEEAETVGAERERGHMLAWAEKRREWLRRENMAGGSAFVEKQQTDYFRDVIAHALYRPDPRDDGTRY